MGRRLPAVRAGVRAGDAPIRPERGLAPDRGRIAEGWLYRFTAGAARTEEAIALYRELGYEVVADAVVEEGFAAECRSCAAGGSTLTAIYTRRSGDHLPPHS